jgi:hypothetical protein
MRGLGAKSYINDLFLAEVGVRRSYLGRTFFTGISTTQINCIAITTIITIVEDETVGAYTFFLYEVSDYFIYVIPAQLLFFLVRRAVAYNHYFTVGVVAHTGSYRSQYSFSVISQVV